MQSQDKSNAYVEAGSSTNNMDSDHRPSTQ